MLIFMDRKKLIIILAGALAIIIVVLLVLWLVRRDKPTDTATTPIENTVTASNRLVIDGRSATDVVTTANAPTLTESQQAQISVDRLATTFAERFGSYASQDNFRNVRDVQPMMTPSMQAWSNGYIQKNVAATAEQNIVVSTRALATDGVTMSGGAAEVTVHTQRREQIDGGAARVYNQDLKLDFVLTDGQWLVDGAYWQ